MRTFHEYRLLREAKGNFYLDQDPFELAKKVSPLYAKRKLSRAITKHGYESEEAEFWSDVADATSDIQYQQVKQRAAQNADITSRAGESEELGGQNAPVYRPSTVNRPTSLISPRPAAVEPKQLPGPTLYPDYKRLESVSETMLPVPDQHRHPDDPTWDTRWGNPGSTPEPQGSGQETTNTIRQSIQYLQKVQRSLQSIIDQGEQPSAAIGPGRI